VFKKYGAKEDAAIIDPGLRQFITLYAPAQSRYFESNGPDMNATLRNLMADCDTFQWLADKAPRRGVRRHFRERLARTRRRLENLVKEGHMKLANELLYTYHTILLPKLNGKELMKRTNAAGAPRTLNKPTTRLFAALSHGKFNQRIRSIQRFHPGTQILRVDEHHTTKTCAKCHYITEVGSSKVFKCAHPGCGNVSSRDGQATSNIAQRALLVTEAAKAGTLQIARVAVAGAAAGGRPNKRQRETPEADSNKKPALGKQ